MFTLIELLVVIAIIAILAAMLLPALSQARSKAMITTTVGNAKQLMTCILQYTGDYDGFYPRGRLGGPPKHLMSWDDYMDDYMGNQMDYATRYGQNPDPVPGWAQILRCPLDDVPRVSGYDWYDRTFTLNGMAYGTASPRIFAYDSDPKSMLESQIDNPTETLAMVEQAKSHNEAFNGGNCLIINAGNMTECTTGVNLAGGVKYNANHHNNNFRNVVAWLDGHISLTYMPGTRDNGDHTWRSKKP